MQNYISEGKIIEILPTEPIQSGDVVKVGKLYGVAVTSAAIGELVAVRIDGVYALPITPGKAVSQGTPVFWDDDDKVVTTIAGNDPKIGYAFQAAAAADSIILVKLWAA